MDIILFAILIVILLFKMVFSLIRGGKRSFVRLGFTLVAAVLAFVLAKPLANLIANTAGISASDIDNVIVRDVAAGSKTFADILSRLPGVVLAPLVFFLLFPLMALLMGIPSGLINRKIEKGSNAGLALVATLLLTLFSFTVAYGPLAAAGSAAFETFQPVIESALTEIGEDSGLPEPVRKIAGKLTSHQFSDMIAIAGRPLLGELTAVRSDGARLSFSDEAFGLLPLASEAMTMAERGEDFEALLSRLPELGRRIDESPLMHKIVAETADCAKREWNAGRTYLGINPDEADDLPGLLVLYVRDESGEFSATDFAEFVLEFLEGSEPGLSEE